MAYLLQFLSSVVLKVPSAVRQYKEIKSTQFGNEEGKYPYPQITHEGVWDADM